MNHSKAKSLRVKSTIQPSKQPSFNDWCKEFKVSLLYNQHEKKLYNYNPERFKIDESTTRRTTY